MSTKIVNVDGIPVTIQRKRIRNMHLYVKPPKGDVLVTAPIYLSEAEILAFVRSKLPWIRSNVDRMHRSPYTLDPQYVTGDILPLWGECRTLQVQQGSRNRVTATEETMVLSLTGDSPLDTRKKLLREFYRSELKERTEILLPQWEQYTGLHCSSWTTRDMKSRWGTCDTRTNKITLNVRLAEHPVECLEYVILHELCHTVVPIHGPEFKALETKFMPDWKQVRDLLNGKYM